ncbi:Uncharacterised protein g11099 [Pycnogonum litorale]
MELMEEGSLNLGEDLVFGEIEGLPNLDENIFNVFESTDVSTGMDTLTTPVTRTETPITDFPLLNGSESSINFEEYCKLADNVLETPETNCVQAAPDSYVEQPDVLSDIISNNTNDQSPILLQPEDLISLQSVLLADINDSGLPDELQSVDISSHTSSDDLITINIHDINEEVQLLPTSVNEANNVDAIESKSKRKQPSKTAVETQDEDNEPVSKCRKYSEMRRKNNIASRKSRMSRKEHIIDQEAKCNELESENEILRIKVEKLEELTAELKKQLIKCVVNNKTKL